MNYLYYIGIDVSKSTLDCSILHNGSFLQHQRIGNDKKEVQAWLKQLQTEHLVDSKNALFCMEYTGPYPNLLLGELHKKGFAVWVENALNIKLSLGLLRGKSDQIDSLRIAQFACTNIKKARLWEPPREVIERLRLLRALRLRVLNAINSISAPLKKERHFYLKRMTKQIDSLYEESVTALKKDLSRIDKALLAAIKQDTHLRQLFALITSVKGIGPVIAVEFIVVTNEFKNITTAKRFACYCGVAPFSYSSGTSVKSKARISRKANLKMKSLLHLAAMAAIQSEGELKNYYTRKVGEGKTKMCVLNIIRNKLIHRIFACIEHQRKYNSDYAIQPLAGKNDPGDSNFKRP